jgi:hypothetical protein
MQPSGPFAGLEEWRQRLWGGPAALSSHQISACQTAAGSGQGGWAARHKRSHAGCDGRPWAAWPLSPASASSGTASQVSMSAPQRLVVPGRPFAAASLSTVGSLQPQLPQAPPAPSRPATAEPLPPASTASTATAGAAPFTPATASAATAKAELGRATWTLLHTLAAQLPDQPSRQQQRDVAALIDLLTRMYPCGDCARHFGALVK